LTSMWLSGSSLFNHIYFMGDTIVRQSHGR
jgi:hypothetical protein